MTRQGVCPFCGAANFVDGQTSTILTCCGCGRSLAASDRPMQRTVPIRTVPVPPPIVAPPVSSPLRVAHRHPARKVVMGAIISAGMVFGVVLGWSVAHSGNKHPVSQSPFASLPPSHFAVAPDHSLAISRESVQALHIPTKPVEVISEPPTPPPVAAPNPVVTPTVTVSASSESLADLIERIEPSIVRVNVTGRQGSGHGSGFVADKEGRIVTNFHVIADATRAEVVFKDGRTAPVRGTLAALESHDLAVLKIDIPAARLTPIIVAATVPRKGDRVAAFGAPLGFSFTTSDGLVSAIRSGRELDGEFRSLGMPLDNDPRLTWVQTTAPISRGNSGGPLVNMQGEVVGVNTLSIPNLGQNLNFAVSSTDIAAILKQADGDVRPLEPRNAPQAQPVGPRPRPRDASIGIIDGRNTAEGRRLLTSLQKIKLVVAPAETPAPLANASSAALEQVARHCATALREAGFQLTDTADDETGLAVIGFRSAMKGPRMLDCQLELALFRSNPDGQRQVVMLFNDTGHDTLPLAQALDSSRLAAKLNRHGTTLAETLALARKQAR